MLQYLGIGFVMGASLVATIMWAVGKLIIVVQQDDK